jgi:hypothetical protein
MNLMKKGKFIMKIMNIRKIKELIKVIKHDVSMLSDRESKDFNYYYNLVRGNLIDLYKMIKLK